MYVLQRQCLWGRNPWPGLLQAPEQTEHRDFSMELVWALQVSHWRWRLSVSPEGGTAVTSCECNTKAEPDSSSYSPGPGPWAPGGYFSHWHKELKLNFF